MTAVKPSAARWAIVLTVTSMALLAWSATGPLSGSTAGRVPAAPLGASSPTLSASPPASGASASAPSEVGASPLPSSASNAYGPVPDGLVSVSLPSYYFDDAEVSTTMVGTTAAGDQLPNDSWAQNVYAVPGPVEVFVEVTDCCLVGDYYELWETTDSSLHTGWSLVGTTPEVPTGSALVAPGYDPHWSGTGSVYSSASFAVAIPSGVTEYFAVRDALFDEVGGVLDGPCAETTVELNTIGCTAAGISVGSGWSPAGFAIAFSGPRVPAYPVAFDESGLPAGAAWSANLSGLFNRTTTDSLGFLVPNGSYVFTIGAAGGDAADPATGTVVVDGGAVTVDVAFRHAYTVSFRPSVEGGLPTGTLWSVWCGGMLASSSPTNEAIAFTVPNGSFAFYVNFVAGYIVGTNASGSVTVAGADRTVNVTFDPIHYVIFRETGLTVGLSWEASLGTLWGETVNSSLSFGVMSGVYAYTVGTDSPEAFKVKPSASGSVTVGATNVSVNVTFVPPPFYNITFVQRGLPLGTLWGVFTSTNVLYSNNSTTARSFVLQLPNASSAQDTYCAYTEDVVGYSAPCGVGFAVAGANETVNVTFVPVWPVTFREQGLPAGAGLEWAVGYLNLESLSSGFVGYVVAGDTIQAELPNATFYAFGHASNESYNGSQSLFVVDGAPAVVTVQFVLATENVAFYETGLPAKLVAKKGWTAVLDGIVEHSTSSTFVMDHVPVGSVPLLVTAPGYDVVSIGEYVVAGVTTINVAFQKGHTVTLSFAEKGLTRGTMWCVSVLGFDQCTSKSSLKFADLTPGTYTYSVGTVSGKTGSLTFAKKYPAPLSGSWSLAKNTKGVVRFTSSDVRSG
ncbi:MAG TPA: hypothetical protein VMH49_01640 [Thermoplasmata archaeon]|nr:hypothetical protein [Thermoplasmata archaeon]